MIKNYRQAAICFTAVFTILSHGMYGQIANDPGGERRWSIIVSAGAGQSKLVETAFSHLIYKGYNPGLEIAMGYSAGKYEHNLLLSGIRGKLRSESTAGYEAEYLKFDFNYSFLIKFAGSGEGFQAFAGPGMMVFTSDRIFKGLINRNHTFDNLGSVGLALKLRYQQKNSQKGFLATNNLLIPVISGYGDEVNEKTAEGANLQTVKPGIRNLFRYNELIGIPDALVIKNSFMVQKVLTDRQAIGLVYNWHYFDLKPGNRTKHANHQLLINYQFTF